MPCARPCEASEHLHVLLFVEDTTLRTWHWERLCAPFDGSWDFLAAQPAYALLALPAHVHDHHFPPIGRRDLRALVVAASPASLETFGLKPFDVAGTIASLQQDRQHPHGVLADSVAGRRRG